MFKPIYFAITNNVTASFPRNTCRSG